MDTPPLNFRMLCSGRMDRAPANWELGGIPEDAHPVCARAKSCWAHSAQGDTGAGKGIETSVVFRRIVGESINPKTVACDYRAEGSALWPLGLLVELFQEIKVCPGTWAVEVHTLPLIVIESS